MVGWIKKIFGYTEEYEMFKKILHDRYWVLFVNLTPQQQATEIKKLETTMRSSKEYYPDSYKAYNKAAKHWLVEMRYDLKLQAAEAKARKIIEKMEKSID